MQLEYNKNYYNITIAMGKEFSVIISSVTKQGGYGDRLDKIYSVMWTANFWLSW